MCFITCVRSLAGFALVYAATIGVIEGACPSTGANDITCTIGSAAHVVVSNATSGAATTPPRHPLRARLAVLPSPASHFG